MPVICRDKAGSKISQTRNRSRHNRKRSSCIAINGQLVRPRCLSEPKGKQNAMRTHPRNSLVHTLDNRKEGNVPEARLAVTRSGEDLSKEIDFSAACMRVTISGIKWKIYTTHLANFWVLPPRLAGQGLGGSSKRRKDKGPRCQGGCDTPEALLQEKQGSSLTLWRPDRLGLQLRTTSTDVSGDEDKYRCTESPRSGSVPR